MTKFSSATLLPADVTHEKHRGRHLHIAWKICPTYFPLHIGGREHHIMTRWVGCPHVSPVQEDALLREKTTIREAE